MIRFIHLRVRALSWDAEGALGIELVPLRADLELPAFEAGAVIDLHLPSDQGEQVFSAALTNDPTERDRYCVLFNVEACGAGAASQIHQRLTAGQTLRVSAPRNIAAGGGAPSPAVTGFTVRLRKSDRELAVRPGQTILEALLADGLFLAHSCRAGTCGTCMVTVLAGEPDHQDRILSDAEKAANDRMTICCSGSKTPVLELDL